MTATCGNRLLIAEDEPLLRVSMADALRKKGWTVDVAVDGVKALALYEQYLHDVVVTDLGVQLARALIGLLAIHGTSESTRAARRG